MVFIDKLINITNIYLLAGPFDAYKDVDTSKDADYGMYSHLAASTLETEVGIYHILQTAGVYLIAIALVLGGILLMVSKFGSPAKMGESKSNIVKILIVSILMFAVAGIVSIVVGAAL